MLSFYCLVQGEGDDVRDMPGENLPTRRVKDGVGDLFSNAMN
jgi:hypothetical protein